MARRATQNEKQKTARAKREKGKRPRAGRLLLAFLGTGCLLFALVWYAVHHFDWAGPLLANSLRAVFGDDNVAKLEDLVYGAEDRVNRLLKKNEPPKAYWQIPGTASAAARPAESSPAPVAEAQPSASEAFHPANPGPALKEWSAPGDGKWLGLQDVRHAGEPPR